MGMFDGVDAPAAGVAEQEERVTSVEKKKPEDYQVEGGVHDATVKAAYLHESKGGAVGLNVELEIGEKTVRAAGPMGAIYLTSGTAKGKKTTYNKDGTDYPLPGYSLGNSLSELAIQKEITGLATSKKFIKKYDYKEGKEVNVEVDMIDDLIGQKIKVGVIQQIEDERQENPAGSGNWGPSGYSRLVNKVDKFFDPETSQTVVERDAKIDAEFVSKWEERFKGTTPDATENSIGLRKKGEMEAGATGAGDPDVDDDLFDDD